MAQTYIKQVMESMGWTDGTHIPIANEENRKLLSSINVLLKEKVEKSSGLEIANSRVTNLAVHCQNAETNIAQNLKLINAHRSQMSTESHLSKIGEYEDTKFQHLLKDLDKEHEGMKKYEEKTTNEIKRVSKNIEQLSDKINWAKQALIEWRQAMSKGEATNKLIERFCKEDQSKADALESKRRLTQATIVKQRKVLIDSYEEQKSLEQILERTAQLYRQAHSERRQLINTWKEAVNQMQQRENDIELSEKDLEQALILSTQKAAQLKEQEDFLAQQLLNNKEVERAIIDLNEELSEVKKRLADLIESNALRNNEAQIAQKQVNGVLQKLQQQRQRNNQIVQEKIRVEQTMKQTDKQITDLVNRYEKFKNETMSGAERLKQLDELLETEEKLKNQLAQETTRLNNILYRSQQQLGSLRNEDKILNIQNRGLEATISNIYKSIKDDEKEIVRKVEQCYNLGFKVQQLEMRISRKQGIQKDVDPEKEARIAALVERNKNATKQQGLLQAQISQVEDDMRKLTSSYNDDMHEMEKMAFQIKEKETVYEGGQKKLKEMTASNQEKLVELSVLKMRLSQMEKQIARHDDKLYSLEKHRMELENTISERMINIKSQLELLLMKRKHLVDERATLKADIGERRIRIDAMKKRYELAIDLLGKNEDGSIVTATQLRIEAAQEKQILLQEGNELNEKVLRAEKDVKAMENTLCLINYSNDMYRKSFGQCDDDNPQLIELTELKKEYCEVLTQLRCVRSSINLRSGDLEQALQKRESLERELDDLNRNRMDNNDVLLKVHKELTDQKLKLQRAERELKAAQKAARQRCHEPEYFSQFERELDLRELEEKNTTALQLLADLVDMSSDLAPVVSALLYEKGMKIPQVRRLKASSSGRSEYSERSVSETSLRIFSASSKGSVSCSTSSSSSKLMIRTGSSAQPSIVSLEFPGETATIKKLCDSKSSAISKKSN